MAKPGKLQEFIKDLKDEDDDDELEDEVLIAKTNAKSPPNSMNQPGAIPPSLADNPDLKRQIHHRRIRHVVFNIKMAFFLMVWLFCFISIALSQNYVPEDYFITIPPNDKYAKTLEDTEDMKCIMLFLRGRFDFRAQTEDAGQFLKVYLQRNNEIVSDVWSLRLLDGDRMNEAHETDLKVFNTDSIDKNNLQLIFENDDANDLVVMMNMNTDAKSSTVRLACSFILLGILYSLIVFDIVDRTFAAVLLCTFGIALVAFLMERPSFSGIMSWIDVETLLLIFGMMILVGILSETGVFDYFAVIIYKLTRGKSWPLIMTLCIFSGIGSGLLDSITMVMLLTPVTIRLCEVMSLNSTPVLISIVLISNMGGALTSFGDPPNIIIVSTKYVMQHNVNVVTVSSHMGPGLLMCMALALLQLRYQLGNKGIKAAQLTEEQQIKQQIKIWKRAADGITPYTAPERELRDDMVKQVNSLKNMYRQHKNDEPKKDNIVLRPSQVFANTLQELQRKYPIQNKVLLIKCGIALGFAVLMFFLQAVPALKGLSPAWTALLAVLFLLIITGKHRMGVILARVDWAPLMFFMALFIIMESVSALGLIDFMGYYIIKLILIVDEHYRLGVAVVLLLWTTSAISTIIDNVPATTMMLKLVISLSKNRDLNLPLTPLLWALSFGIALGGNATLIGASANIVCAGLAEQHNYKFSFYDWVKLGFPVMLTTTIFATFYLYVTHVVLKWY